jgi:DMSO reductase anchor subunit
MDTDEYEDPFPDDPISTPEADARAMRAGLAAWVFAWLLAVCIFAGVILASIHLGGPLR